MKKNKTINWTRIIVHFFGMLFIALAFQSFAYLTNLPLSEAIRNGITPQSDLAKQTTETSMNDLWFTIEIARAIGFVFAFILSLLIARGRNWYVGNSMLSLLLVLVVGLTGFLGWSFRNSALLFPVGFLPGASFYIVLGSLFLIIGLILLFLRAPADVKHHRKVTEHRHAV